MPKLKRNNLTRKVSQKGTQGEATTRNTDREKKGPADLTMEPRGKTKRGGRANRKKKSEWGGKGEAI